MQEWIKVLEEIKTQVSAAAYRTFFAQTSADLSDKQLTVKAKSAFIKDTLSTKLRPILEEALSKVYGDNLKISFIVDPSLLGKEVKLDELVELESFQPKARLTETNLNPKYTLANFVVGLSNNLAYAAAQAVVQNPGQSYNPLFIYGGTGVGKTHLMVGIGNALLNKNPSLKVVYCTSERFMNDFIQSIQLKRTQEFRTKYRSLDLLLIDDIQFISGRDSTQEEFFHTFNELQSKNTQVVLTSDRPPNEIDKLEPRLASRFQGGLMVDIQLPDFDTRVAILRARCQEKNEFVPEECITLIAESLPTNARELEGKLLQIVQMAKLSKQEVTTDFIRKILGQRNPQSKKFDYKKVLSIVNQYFSIKMADLTGPRRKKELVVPRQFAMYILYEDCHLPYERIGGILGGRDHTTILHGVEKIREAVTRDREVQRILIEIKQNLQS